MIGPGMQKALNHQVNAELYSPYLYLAMEACFESGNLAVQEKDHAANAFLQWFVSEQVEEEISADSIVQQLKMIENAPGTLFLIDREMGRRVFTPPATQGE